MRRTITVTTERIRRVTVRRLRTPAADETTPQPITIPEEKHPEEEKEMNRKKLIGAFAFVLLAALPARPQGPPFVTGLQLPTKVAFTRFGNLVVAEAGTPANNTGRVSLVDRTTRARRTLLEGLPSGISRAEEPGSPSGPSGVAVQDHTVYLTIGVGEGVLPGPAPGTEQRNPTIASPILASLLSLRSSVPLDRAAGGFALIPADHARLKAGESITLRNAGGEELVVKLVADFPDYVEEPRPDFAANVRAGNPFGVTVRGQTLYVVDASLNLVRRVDANTGQTTVLTTFGKVANPLPMGAPVIDPVPDSIHFRGDDLVVTTLTGFPFPAGKAEVRKVNATSGANETLVSGLSTAIDVAPLGSGPNDPLLVLEFSTAMLQQLPGRLRLVTPSGTSTTVAEGLPTPTSMAVDATTGEVFITHIFPGFITRVNAAASLPAAPPTAVVPVVAQLAGAFRTHYTTSMQISNPYPFAISGRVVVHPAGLAGGAGDPSTAYTLAPFETRSLTGVIADGSGSADVLAAGGALPVIVTIITETSGNAVQIPIVTPDEAIAAGLSGTLITPPDPARHRFNIGIRTLNTGAALTMRVRDSSGAVVATVTRAYPANFFQQFSFSELFGVAQGANHSVSFEVTAGSAIVYGAAVDNATGAMTLQVANGG
ncbi:MAG TPA: ScyD/ScyE family protein [Thermoanaerobaculia bacterium]|nr:ScyD/ScyE family protein [Thermoanaerobaculia bacterium]